MMKSIIGIEIKTYVYGRLHQFYKNNFYFNTDADTSTHINGIIINPLYFIGIKPGLRWVVIIIIIKEINNNNNPPMIRLNAYKI